MEYSYIVNPLTNRKVSIHSRKGQSILKAYLNQAQYAQAGGSRRGRRGRGRKEDRATTFNKEGDPFFPEGYEPEQHSHEIAENREKARQENWAFNEERMRQQRESKPTKTSSPKQRSCRYNPVSKRCGRSSKHTLETDPETGITYCTESGVTKGEKYRACHHSDEWKAHLRGHHDKSKKLVRVVKPVISEHEYSSREEDTHESDSDSEIDRSQPHPIFGKVCKDKEKKVCHELHDRGLCNWYEPKGKKPYCRSTGKFGALNPKSKSKK